MRRYRLVPLAAVMGVVALAPQASHGGDVPADPPFAVVDLHVDIPWQVHFKGRGAGLTEGQARIETLVAGHYGGLVFPIYLPDKSHPTIADADAVYGTIAAIIAKNDLFLPLDAPVAKEGKISTFLAIEGGGAFAEDITQIDLFIARGLRLVSPCHVVNTRLASAATGAKVDFGLTALGKEFAERVYEKGALMDVSHVSDAAFADIAEIARRHGAPVVATHSDARAVAGAPRNLTDAELRVIAETGGVAGLNLHAPFVTGTNDATLDDVVKQVDHMVKVAGVDHVAIGSDFDGGIKAPSDMPDAASLPRLAAELRRRGMSYDDVLKIFSLNALRVLGWRPVPLGGPRAPQTPGDGAPAPPSPPAPPPG